LTALVQSIQREEPFLMSKSDLLLKQV